MWSTHRIVAIVVTAGLAWLLYQRRNRPCTHRSESSSKSKPLITNNTLSTATRSPVPSLPSSTRNSIPDRPSRPVSTSTTPTPDTVRDVSVEASTMTTSSCLIGSTGATGSNGLTKNDHHVPSCTFTEFVSKRLEQLCNKSITCCDVREAYEEFGRYNQHWKLPLAKLEDQIVSMSIAKLGWVKSLSLKRIANKFRKKGYTCEHVNSQRR